MTFGEKLKEARKEAGLSQEQFAEKLSVSRSAVAKWESDKGMPDISNLRGIAQLLGISIDYLLDEDEKLSFNETKEPIELDSYQKSGKCRDRKDAACYAKYPDADAIWPLIRSKKLNKKEFLLDLVTQWGGSQLVDYANNMDGYYLVEKGSRQYLVRVSKDFIYTGELANRVDPKGFDVGSSHFKKAGYQLIQQ